MRVMQIFTASSARLHNILTPNAEALSSRIMLIVFAADQARSHSKELIDASFKISSNNRGGGF